MFVMFAPFPLKDDADISPLVSISLVNKPNIVLDVPDEVILFAIPIKIICIKLK